MRLFAVFSIAIVIACVACTNSDIPICLPYLLQALFIRFETSDYGVLALNFVTNMMAKHIINLNVRTVYNLTERVAYTIDLTTGGCKKHDMLPTEIINRCLPSSARQYSPNNSFVGYGKHSLGMQAFEVDLPQGGMARVAFTVSDPAFILASQLTGFSTEEKESYFYFDSSPTADPILFVIPPSCL